MIEKRKLDLVQHIRPLHLMTLIVLYFLGVGFGRYLGQRIDLVPLLLGLFWILTLSIGLNFLGDYFQTPFDWGWVRKKQGENDSQEKDRDEVLLYISVASLAVGAVLTVILGIFGTLSLSIGLVLASYFLLYCLIIIPGISLDLSGIGEFLTSIILVVLPPAIGYLLQAGEFHRLL